ncbi:hydrolase, partial [Escherichia coli]
TLAERQEARAERFTGYSGKRASESAQALDEVERLAAMIPPGQPILVGHHSERRARRDAQRIENGMKRAVMLFERAEYWEERARSALLHAKYKERPDVRWRRIKKIEADLRKAEKTIAQSQKYLTMWRAESLDLNMAKLISSHDHISACFPLDTYPRPAEKSQYEGSRSLWSALDDDIITTEQAREIAIRCHERQIQHQQRWVNHYQNRLIYERAMLDESGGVVTRTQDFEPGGQVFSRGEWLTIIRVNKSNGAVSSVTTP